jgi:hypothetical protein
MAYRAYDLCEDLRGFSDSTLSKLVYADTNLWDIRFTEELISEINDQFKYTQAQFEVLMYDLALEAEDLALMESQKNHPGDTEND